MYPLHSLLALTLCIISILPSIWSNPLPKSHRGVPTATQLEYAQSPGDFLKSQGPHGVNQDNDNYIRKTARHNSGGSGPATHSFDGALSYDKYAPQGNNHGSNTGATPTAALYNNYHYKQPTDYGRRFSTASNAYNGAVSNNAAQHPSQQTAQSYHSSLQTPKQQYSSAANYFPKNANVQQKLDFDLFNSKEPNQAAPGFGRGVQSFDGGSARNHHSNPFTRYTETNTFKPHLQSPYHNLASAPRNQVASGYNNHNTGQDFNGFRPILAQGFSVPTTYQGEERTHILPNEAFSSVTDPKSDKRAAIGTYVPSNNFVNPSNFLIPTEDKYSMISRIFGGFKVPGQEEKQQQQRPQQQQQNHPQQPQQTKQNPHNKPHSPHSTQSPETGPYNTLTSFKGNNAAYHNPTGETHLAQNSFGNKYNSDINNSNYPNKDTDIQSAAKSAQGTNRGSYFSASKSLAKPGYGQGFDDQGSFSYSSVQSPSSEYNKGAVFGAREDPPTLLFSDFTYNNPLSLNQFRSKNLLGDENFGKTEYDNNRLTPDILFERNNKNYYQNGDFFAPNSNSQKSGKVSGSNGYQQIGGGNAATGNSYDKSYSDNRRFDTAYDDNGQTNGKVLGYSPQNVGFSDHSTKTNDYNNDAGYSDGDGHSNSFRYSDGGSESDFRAAGEDNEKEYEKSYENSEDDNNMDSYNDSQGYSRQHYDGNNHDVTDGYTDNVNYDTNRQQNSNTKHYNTNGNDGDGVNNYHQGVAKVASALASSGTPTVHPYRGITKSVTENLPTQANYKPFNVSGPVTE